MKTKFLLMLAAATIMCNNIFALVLPINIIKFKANLLHTHVQLKWNAETDDNSRSFTIESSRDGLVWKSIGTVMATGNNNTVNTYRFADVNAVEGNNYYRIKATDTRGDSDYSVVRLVTLEGHKSR